MVGWRVRAALFGRDDTLIRATGRGMSGRAAWSPGATATGSDS
jgi:hypothetical protein